MKRVFPVDTASYTLNLGWECMCMLAQSSICQNWSGRTRKYIQSTVYTGHCL